MDGIRNVSVEKGRLEGGEEGGGGMGVFEATKVNT